MVRWVTHTEVKQWQKVLIKWEDFESDKLNIFLFKKNEKVGSVDRFGNTNSALSLNNGYTYIPTGNYFSTNQLSISLWLLPKGANSWARIIDFSNGPNSNNLIFSLSLTSANYSMKSQFIFTTNSTTCLSNTSLTTNQWSFVTLTFDGSYIRLYINGLISLKGFLIHDKWSKFSSFCRIFTFPSGKQKKTKSIFFRGLINKLVDWKIVLFLIWFSSLFLRQCRF